LFSVDGIIGKLFITPRMIGAASAPVQTAGTIL
jgi:hypothetical protein